MENQPSQPIVTMTICNENIKKPSYWVQMQDLYEYSTIMYRPLEICPGINFDDINYVHIILCPNYFCKMLQ